MKFCYKFDEVSIEVSAKIWLQICAFGRAYAQYAREKHACARAYASAPGTFPMSLNMQVFLRKSDFSITSP